MKKSLPSSCVQLVFSYETNLSVLENRLKTAASRGIDTLIVLFSSEDIKPAHQIRALCDRLGMSLYLWFPIFADNPVLDISRPVVPASYLQQDAVRDFYADEDFVFVCPNDRDNFSTVFSFYADWLDSGLFDGVFLDRIRFPAPSNGFDMLFSCFCDLCLEAFPFLEDVRGLEHPVAAFFDSDCLSFSDFLEDTGYAQWQEYRLSSVYKAVSVFADAARARGVSVALDLFSPSLAPLVGQDYVRLSSLADWIKPMVYLSAQGPAGLSFELDALVSYPARTRSASCVESFLRRLTGFSLSFGDNSVVLPPDFFCYELEAACSLSSAPVYAGIELVRTSDSRFCVDRVLAEFYAESLRSLGLPYVASWDLQVIPDEYLKLFSCVAR